MRLFTYRITHDTGFAPNPFHGFLTLATCKPGIRRTKKVGDWIAGFASIALNNNSKSININPNALIYLGNVSKVVSLAYYYHGNEYKKKIPPGNNLNNLIACAGDNIYMPSGDGAFEQLPNQHHNDSNFDHDISGENVLVMNEFYYMGRDARPIPKIINISIPKGPSLYGNKTLSDNEITKLINWVKKEYKPGINAMPCIWDDDITNNNCGR